MKKILESGVWVVGVGLLMAALGVGPGQAGTMLFDFGDAATPSGVGVTGPEVTWNDISSADAASDFAEIFGLVTTNGTATAIGLRMVSRFNGANENGTTSSTRYPASATRDSMFGNTELFSNLENITPIFQVTGLTPGAAYDFAFYASRTGVSDNRETRYTVTGENEKTADLNVANNVDTAVAVTAITANGSGEVTIALTPGPNNNNGNHFVYLGVMVVQSVAESAVRLLFDFGPPAAGTGVVRPDPGLRWNNVTATVGTDPAASVPGLVTTNGTDTGYALQMVSRFNGANTAGSTASTVFPGSATRDSLFGNTEAFGGLSNLTPQFKLTGLNSAAVYDFTFYGSRTGANDNRETRYTVVGTTTQFGDLNTANNVDEAVTVAGITPTEAGEITIRLRAGPNNNNANHFVYLGAMQMEWGFPFRPTYLFDLGAAATTTVFGADDTENSWNNVDATLGASDTAAVTNLVTANGTVTGARFQMVSRFNGANANGTTASTLFPVRATQDSLFGNTELFSGLENAAPFFKLTGLTAGTPHDFTFYASRMGVGDNRETRYTVTGSNAGMADLNAANNEEEVALVKGIRPDAAGEITVSLTPGPNNDNGNHFTYLGVMRVDWVPRVEIGLSSPSYAGGVFSFRLRGGAGRSYRIQGSTDLTTWTDAQTVTLVGDSATVTITATGAARFFRAAE